MSHVLRVTRSLPGYHLGLLKGKICTLGLLSVGIGMVAIFDYAKKHRMHSLHADKLLLSDLQSFHSMIKLLLNLFNTAKQMVVGGGTNCCLS